MEIDLEDRFFSIEISFCFSIFTAKSEIWISKFQSKFTNRKHPEPWNALLTSKEEEARKGALKIVRLITPLPAYHGWRGSPAAVEKQAVENWEALAADRPTWHSAVSSDARLAEKSGFRSPKTKEPFARCEQRLQPVQYQSFPVQHANASSSQGQASQGIFLRTDLDFSVFNIRSLMVIVEYDRRTTTFNKK